MKEDKIKYPLVGCTTHSTFTVGQGGNLKAYLADRMTYHGHSKSDLDLRRGVRDDSRRISRRLRYHEPDAVRPAAYLWRIVHENLVTGKNRLTATSNSGKEKGFRQDVWEGISYFQYSLSILHSALNLCEGRRKICPRLPSSTCGAYACVYVELVWRRCAHFEEPRHPERVLCMLGESHGERGETRRKATEENWDVQNLCSVIRLSHFLSADLRS